MDNSSKPAANKPVLQKQKKLDFSSGKLKVGKDDAEVEGEPVVGRKYDLVGMSSLNPANSKHGEIAEMLIEPSPSELGTLVTKCTKTAYLCLAKSGFEVETSKIEVFLGPAGAKGKKLSATVPSGAPLERLITEAGALIPRVYALNTPGFDAKGVEVSTRDTVSSTSSHSLWKLDLFVSSQVDLLHGQVEQDGHGEVGEGRVRPHGPAQGQAEEPAGLGSRAWPSRSCRL